MSKHRKFIVGSKFNQSVLPDLIAAENDQLALVQLKDSLPKFGTDFVKTFTTSIEEAVRKLYEGIDANFAVEKISYRHIGSFRFAGSFRTVTKINGCRPDIDVVSFINTEAQSTKDDNNYRYQFAKKHTSSLIPFGAGESTASLKDFFTVEAPSHYATTSHAVRLLKYIAQELHIHDFHSFVDQAKMKSEDELIKIANKFNSALLKASEENKKHIKSLNKLLDLYRYITFDVRTRIRTIIRSLHILPFDGKDDDSEASAKQRKHYYLTLSYKQFKWQVKTYSSSWLTMQLAG